MKNKVLSIMLGLALTLSLAACSGPDSSVAETAEEPTPTATDAGEETPDAGVEATDGEYKIAILLPGPTGYFVAVREGLDAAAAELGVTLEYADAQWDAAKQLSQVEDYISKSDIDLIAVCAADSEAILPGIKAANDAGMPILALCNAVGDDPNGEYEGLVSYVGQNEVKSGALCGEIAIKLLGEEGGNVVLIEGRPGTFPQRYRREGLMQAFEGNDNIEVVYTQTSNWEQEEAMKITEDIISKDMDFDLIVCQDDNSAIGAGKALLEAGMKDDVYVIGLGGSIDGLQALQDGTIDGTTFISGVAEGRLAVETAYKYLTGGEVQPLTEINQVEVNLDNVDTFEGEW